MAERISGAALTLAFNKRANSELGVLHEKLEVQLRDDISKVYTESLYTDLEISFASGCIQTHSYVLKTRAPRFYSELCSIQYKLPSVVNIQFIESFVRDIYSENVITERENDLVAYLSKLNKVCRHSIDVCTPESDVYLTPETSPTDIKHRYGHTRCVSDSGISNLTNSSVNLRKTNALYYSLVTVDEVFDSYTSETEAVLEKELAEQDELFKSFKSIISREVQNCNSNKGNKPSTFTLPFSPKQRQTFPRVQTKSLSKAACLDFKFDLNRTIKERYSQKNYIGTNSKVEKQTINNLNEQIKHSKTLNNFQPVVISDIVENVLKESDTKFTINNDRKCLYEVIETKQLEVMNKIHKLEVDEVMSNPEIDTQGQDSCLEAGSSGYLTGSSPKDQTVSETSGADVTEVATSDDIPHDNDQSVQSSSVSSDGGTWDSTFPNTTSIDGSITNQGSAVLVCSRIDAKQEQLNNFDVKVLNNSVNSSENNTDTTFKTQLRDTLQPIEQVTASHKEVSLQELGKDYFSTQDLLTNCNQEDDGNVLEKNIVYNLKSYTSEWNSPEVCTKPDVVDETASFKLGKQLFFSDQEDCEFETYIRHSEDRVELHDKSEIDNNSSICKTNCFIDASSLSDESEVPVPTPRIPHLDNVYYDLFDVGVANHSPDVFNVANTTKQDELSSQHNKHECGITKSDNFTTGNNNLIYDESEKPDVEFSKTNIISGESLSHSTHLVTKIEKSITPTVEDKSKQISTDFENRRASLIRRNTFELEPDDEKLAMLRQEYEKRQGNIIFQSCSQSSNNSDSNSEIDINLSLTEINSKGSLKVLKQDPPDSLLIQKNLHIRPLADDEAQSPDSLNNDGPVDNTFHIKMEKKVKSSDAMNVEDFDDFESKYVMGNKVSQRDERNHKESNHSNFDNTNYYITFKNPSSSDMSSMFSNKSNSLNSYSLNENSSLENKIESMPIVSGGASVDDFPINNEVSASPLMNRRKTEFTPIVSGGSVALPTPEPETRPKLNSSLTTSWVVDMSDTVKSPPEARKKKRSNSVLSSASSDHCDFDDNINKSSTRMNNSAMGFFIPLDDPFDEKSSSESGYKSMTPQMPRSLKSKEVTNSSSSETVVTSNVTNCNSSCGFYIDLKGQQELNKQASDSSLPDNKLFTMFIDLGETTSVKSSENISPKTKLGSPHLLSKKNRPIKTHTERFTSKHLVDSLQSEEHHSLESNTDIVEHPEITKGKLLFPSGTPPPSRQISHTDDSTSDLTDSGSKKSFYMFIEADSSPVPRRRTLPSGLRPNIQRHSWNPDSFNAVSTDPQQTEMPKKNHRRAHSVSVDKSLEVMFNVSHGEKKVSSSSSNIKHSNSNSIGYESGPSSMDEHVSRCLDKNNKLMMASWHGSIKPSTELQKVIARSERKDSKEGKSILGMFRTNENKSFDNGCEDKIDPMDRFEETGSVSMKSDETFELSNVSEISSHRDIHNSTFVLDVSNVANATSNAMELSTPSHDFVSELSKDDSDPTETDFIQGFNKERKLDSRVVTIDSKYNLSDRETPTTPDHSVSQPLISLPEETKSSFVKLSDMDKEPARIIFEEKRIVNRMSRSIPEASWIESKMMTRSATSRSLSRLFPHLHTGTRNRTPDSAEQDTDVSEISSLQSSMEPSALEGSTEETDASSCTSGPCSRLGEDLLRMFLDEISPDVTVEVGGRRIKAHKCILSSRCQYFAAILSGGWVESAGNVISLQGFSYNAVHFALCHIYSGTSNIPDSINIVELATLADMLCLEGLKEIIMYTLKVKYCHFFHKPCPMCTVGVLECLPLAAAYGLDEIYRKSLRWITKYFVRVWPTKGFATLPRELLDKCYKQHVVHMSVDNVLETVLCCGKLQSTIPAVRWAEPVVNLTTKLHDSAVKYIAQHFCGILSNEMFLALGKEDLWNVSRLEDTLNTAADKLPPDQACKCHSKLYNILGVLDGPDPPPEMQWNRAFVDLLRRLAIVVENCLIRQAARAARTPAWSLMEPHLRHKIQDAACLVIVPGDERRRARHSSLLKRSEGSCRTGDLHQVKVAMTQQVVTVTRKPTTTTTNTSAARSSSAQCKVRPSSTASTKTEETGPRPKTWPYKVAEVKSRYLEQRTTVKTQTNVRDKPSGSVPVTRRTVSKSIISSSDSSRTSSPAMKPLNTRPSRSLPNKESNLRPKCDDVITMSTDSLAESTMSKPSISGNKTLIKKKADTEVNGNRSLVRTPLMDKTRRILPNRIDGIKNRSTESLTKAKTQGIQSSLNKDSNKTKNSPVPLSKKSSSQSSPGVRDSPLVGGRVKSTVNSTPSPSLRRNTLSSKNPPEVKSSLLKRSSTYKVQTKTSTNQTKSTPVKTPVTSSNIKNYINNRVQSKLTTQSPKLSTNNNPSQQMSDTNKTETKPQPMVGSRSGTFLKDEPTVLKKPQVTNVIE